MPKRKTVIIDLDGTIFKHRGQGATKQYYSSREVLPGVHEFLDKLEREEACIVLMTACPEGLRGVLENELMNADIVYNQLVMGVSSGERIVINDAKADGSPSARALTIIRNVGLKGIEL
jgi:ribonucleotide monophosphatase NagD (HAD superfamily)